ncbi:MAG: ChuX/HutX family heme-like substrate-binding protein [Pseudomonadota bacterium]
MPAPPIARSGGSTLCSAQIPRFETGDNVQIDGVTISREELRLRESAYRNSHAKLRARDLASQLKVPEAALLEARLDATDRGTIVERLAANFADDAHFRGLLARLHEVGEVMALTRNEACVHEKHGSYSRPEFYGAMGQIVGEIDLRLFTQHWSYGYVVREPLENGKVRHSLQFFDASGTAIHKIYATKATDTEAYHRLVSSATDAEPSAAAFTKLSSASAPADDEEIDVAGFQAAWEKLEHSHDFFGLLKTFGVQRLQAMRLVGAGFARPIEASRLEALLKHCAETLIPLMVFVGNSGCVQIHSGPVESIDPMGPWLNVLDPRFNLHLRTDKIAHAFVVRKPSTKGDVHSIELFASDGELIAQVFGERKPGETERDDWRSNVQQL